MHSCSSLNVTRPNLNEQAAAQHDAAIGHNVGPPQESVLQHTNSMSGIADDEGQTSATQHDPAITPTSGTHTLAAASMNLVDQQTAPAVASRYAPRPTWSPFRKRLLSGLIPLLRRQCSRFMVPVCYARRHGGL